MTPVRFTAIGVHIVSQVVIYREAFVVQTQVRRVRSELFGRMFFSKLLGRANGRLINRPNYNLH